MKKQLQRKTVYVPNQGVKVTVINKPIVDQDTGEQYCYETAVTISLKLKDQSKELNFKTDDDIAEFVGNISFDDPQQALAL